MGSISGNNGIGPQWHQIERDEDETSSVRSLPAVTANSSDRFVQDVSDEESSVYSNEIQEDFLEDDPATEESASSNSTEGESAPSNTLSAPVVTEVPNLKKYENTFEVKSKKILGFFRESYLAKVSGDSGNLALADKACNYANLTHGAAKAGKVPLYAAGAAYIAGTGAVIGTGGILGIAGGPVGIVGGFIATLVARIRFATRQNQVVKELQFSNALNKKLAQLKEENSLNHESIKQAIKELVGEKPRSRVKGMFGLDKGTAAESDDAIKLGNYRTQTFRECSTVVKRLEIDLENTPITKEDLSTILDYLPNVTQLYLRIGAEKEGALTSDDIHDIADEHNVNKVNFYKPGEYSRGLFGNKKKYSFQKIYRTHNLSSSIKICWDKAFSFRMEKKLREHTVRFEDRAAEVLKVQKGGLERRLEALEKSQKFSELNHELDKSEKLEDAAVAVARLQREHEALLARINKAVSASQARIAKVQQDGGDETTEITRSAEPVSTGGIDYDLLAQAMLRNMPKG